MIRHAPAASACGNAVHAGIMGAVRVVEPIRPDVPGDDQNVIVHGTIDRTRETGRAQRPGALPCRYGWCG